MRRLNHERGLTLIELMTGLAIAALLAVSAAPYFADYATNSRLREAGNMLYAEALAAQSEAVKRNTSVRLSVSGSTLTLVDLSVPATPVTLRERTLPGGATASGSAIEFVADGRPRDFTEGSINIAISGVTCSSDYRCPGLRVDGGGGVRLCGNNTATDC